ncbi:hypothetical protein Kpol_460p3 [Vanderwaltozyma polyspora DSM 70294]|uniref:Dolichyl-diphosphooligosaccharide-protein glycosyltransferase subunit OST5 n=1 Tax=Vanderwaltozyma polyspora (strain ATCC 22028 / DSM 70294 / BCRC 21397 / CBS 2163 / NBRC 10782 / NRRL Y-8283 / UCD 57-17) TaxID=436907 RepID=A7TQR9_VANPO|nr:uncharacterized protein Kpol_460p3 [Vanderwaltozyma polyspora DSM 70294]EDO15368.1 hypothetical protein Kpol_460p3 [Vanderwaltozyma polyspora DSM 70294]
MSYEQLYNEYTLSRAFEPVFALESQPTMAIVASLISLVLVSLSILVMKSKNHSIVVKFIIFSIISAIASLFCGITTVFTTNSFGVYV